MYDLFETVLAILLFILIYIYIHVLCKFNLIFFLIKTKHACDKQLMDEMNWENVK